MRLVWLLALLLLPVAARAADPSALWKIVNGKCVPHEQNDRDPSPCAEVDLANGVDKGFAVLKDINGAFQFLLIPTARISGIEDSAVLADGATNYFDAAWRSRYFVEERVQTELPRDDVALAINSAFGRTQDQLHIHIDCIDPAVHAALAANLTQVRAVWTPFPVPLAGHNYRAIRIDSETLEGLNPFHVLADDSPETAGAMGRHTLVLVGETYPGDADGFVLLDDQVDAATGDRASGEELQDHTCKIAAKS